MPSSLYTNGESVVCVVQPIGTSGYLVYELNGKRPHGFRFYQMFHQFPLHLADDRPLSRQPFGRISSVTDLTGRMNGNGSFKPLLSSSGNHRKSLDVPVYVKVGEFQREELRRLLRGYRLEESSQPYGVLSVTSRGVAMQGDDLYRDTIFFMRDGSVVHAEISAIAGRADEDCCSPDCFFNATRLSLKDASPPRRRTEGDMIPEAFPSEWELSVGKGFVPSTTISARDSSKALNEFDEMVNRWFNALLPVNS